MWEAKLSYRGFILMEVSTYRYIKYFCTTLFPLAYALLKFCIRSVSAKLPQLIYTVHTARPFNKTLIFFEDSMSNYTPLNV